MDRSKFRAVIIGGGPVGLTIANGLERAGLDFVVVERHPTIISESGAGIMLWPHSVRVFDQLGLLESCEGRYIPLHTRATGHLDGTPIRASSIFEMLVDKYAAFFSRLRDAKNNTYILTKRIATATRA